MMRAAPLILLLVASPLALSAGAQTTVEAPLPPQAQRVPAIPRVRIERQGLDSTTEREMRLLADSIDFLARQAAAGALGENGERLGELRGRLGAMQGQLGALEGKLATQRGRVMVMRHEHRRDPNEVAALLRRIAADPQGISIPQDSVNPGPSTVPAGATTGRVAALGPLDIYGTVNGDAIALDGDVIIHRGGHVTGDAFAVGGTVRLDGGTVDGEMRALDEAVDGKRPSVASRSGFFTVLNEVQRAMGWLVVMVILGFGAMVFAEERLRVVAQTIESRFGRSLGAGLLIEVSFVPGVILAIVLLAVTIVGIVLLPVAIPGIFVVTALLATLGFLAVARVAGQALTRRAATASVRGAELRSLLAGLFFFFGLWLAAALLGWVPVLGSLLHALAFVVTWAAATVGLGAAFISRGGSRLRAAAIPPVESEAPLGWQTPTPIGGVASARRQPTSTSEI